jgi:hypothetical protein
MEQKRRQQQQQQQWRSGGASISSSSARVACRRHQHALPLRVCDMQPLSAVFTSAVITKHLLVTMPFLLHAVVDSKSLTCMTQ